MSLNCLNTDSTLTFAPCSKLCTDYLNTYSGSTQSSNWSLLFHRPFARTNYRSRSNYASFLIVRQNATFQTGNFQWCVTLRKLISYCCGTWLQKWTVIVACHRWCIKLRHNPDMAETSLVVRDGNVLNLEAQSHPDSYTLRPIKYGRNS